MCETQGRKCWVGGHVVRAARLGIWACVLATLAFEPSSRGQDLSGIRSFAYSDWDTIYDSPSGKVRASVHLRGGTGYYILARSGARGILSDIQYFDSFQHDQVLNISQPNPPTPAIVGLFNLSGATGFFVFRLPDARGAMDGYCGSWAHNNGQTWLKYGGSWDGDFRGR